jgi:hypothetical protein
MGGIIMIFWINQSNDIPVDLTGLEAVNMEHINTGVVDMWAGENHHVNGYFYLGF